MPNWEPGYCIERSIQNERVGVHWLDRRDTHCFHGHRCCWCGLRINAIPDSQQHGKYAPRSRKKTIQEVVIDIEPESVK